MRWIYLPFMFALAFLYTKISYNNFQINGVTESQSITRKPASVSDAKVVLSPFYKVPPQVFYKILSDKELMIFKKVEAYRGTIVGNVNVQGFGYVIDDMKKVSFGVNDFSKVTDGVLFHDVLGHLVSSSFLDKRLSWLDYFEAYKKGLKGEKFSFSFYTEKGLDDAFFDSDKVISENISLDFPFEFTLLKKTHHHIDIMKKNLIQNELLKKFPKAQFFDLLEANNNTKNFQILLRLRPQDKIQWLEVQEIVPSEYDMNFNKDKVLDSKKRFEFIRKNIYSDKMNNSLFILEIDKQIFTAKFAEQFRSKIKLQEIPSDDFHDIVMDEAFVLGMIHARSLGEKISSYIKSWATLSVSDIDDQVIDLKSRLVDKELQSINR